MTASSLKSKPLSNVEADKEDPICVLHVDDEVEFLKCTKQLLEMHGSFQVCSASSVEEALEKMEEKKFDVILSDYQMPGKDGLQFLKEVGSEVPFILFTGKGREEVAIKALNLGADGYINKIGKPETVYGELAHCISQSVERQKAKRALVDSDKKFRTLVEHTGVGVAVIQDGHVVFYNNYFYEMMGYTDTEFREVNFQKMIHPEDRTLAMERIRQRMAHQLQSSAGIQLRLLTKSGRILPVEATSFKSEWDNKPALMAYILKIDEQKSENTRARKHLEKKLRDAEKKYHAIFDKTPLGILIIDSSGTAVDFNEAAHRQLGYSREEFKKLTVSNYEVLETPEQTRARMNKILKTRKDEFESKHRTKTGEIRDVKNVVQLITISGKSFFQVITEDITEQKRAERNLKEREETYRELLNGMNDTVWVIDLDCSIIDTNDAAIELLGYSREELRSIGLTGIDSNLDPKEIKALVEGMPTDEIQVFETVHTTKTGKRIPVEISSSLVTYKGKRAILSIARDITKRKQAEKKLDMVMNDMVKINEKLGVIGKLTRHDVRNKLAVISNNAYLIKREVAENQNALEYLGQVQSAVDQIDQLFDFARTYEMVGIEVTTCIDVEKCFNEAVRGGFDLTGIQLVNDCNGLMVMADSLLRKVFYNLIDNTLKYGEKVSQIRGYYEEEAEQLKLVYEDNGIGIPEDEKEKIFENGYGKGTGYGLYLIKKICEAYGWTIQEIGKEGKGAQFTMTIPKISINTKTSYQIQK